MRILTVVVAMIVVLAYGLALADCPGNVLTGEHWPEGGPKWSWTLDAKTGEAVIEKSDSKVTGHVDMLCSKDKWSAHLTRMSHGVEYNCNGDLSESSIGNGRCTTNLGGRINVTGTFSTHN
jgi:hypothetical protein